MRWALDIILHFATVVSALLQFLALLAYAQFLPKNNGNLSANNASLKQAVQKFDSLAPVDVSFLLGRWTGTPYHTCHFLDGLLETYHWYGKQFDDTDHVHPLLFSAEDGRIMKIDVGSFGGFLGAIEWINIPNSKLAGRLAQKLLGLLQTTKSTARMRMMKHRDQLTATLIYDRIPVTDSFRKVNENCVMGMMDLKGIDRPLFFLLHKVEQ